MRIAEFAADHAAVKVAAMVTSGASSVASIVTHDWSVAVFGVPLAVLFAGFAGSVVALSFLDPMSRRRAFIAVSAGTFCAAYGTKVAAHVLSWGGDLLPGIAFLIGLGAFLVLTWAFRVTPSWLSRKAGVDQ